MISGIPSWRESRYWCGIPVEFDGTAQAFEDFAVEADDIPKRSAGQVGAGIVEAVDFPKFDSREIGGGGDDAAAAGTEIDGKKSFLVHGRVLVSAGMIFHAGRQINPICLRMT
jgi:hypothetical protein